MVRGLFICGARGNSSGTLQTGQLTVVPGRGVHGDGKRAQHGNRLHDTSLVVHKLDVASDSGNTRSSAWLGGVVEAEGGGGGKHW